MVLESVPQWRLYLMTSALAALNFTWTLEFAIVTPYFEQRLSASTNWSHIVWLIGPISGFVVAPVVGAASDSCTSSWGRRRPFLIVGLLFSLLGMFVFSHTVPIAQYIAQDTIEKSKHAQVVALAVATTSFGVLDFSLNAATWPMRALLGDLVPDHQQHDAQSVAMVVYSAGEIAASLIVSLFPDPLQNVAAIFYIAMALSVVAFAISLALCKETPLGYTQLPTQPEHEFDSTNPDPHLYGMQHEPVDAYSPLHTATNGNNTDVHLSQQQLDPSTQSLISRLRELMSTPPYRLLKICVVYMLGWLSLFCAFPFYSSWIGENILNGNPKAAVGTPQYDNYEHGVTLYGRANTMKAIFCVILSMLQPKFLHAMSPKALTTSAFFMFAFILFVASYAHRVALAVIVVALTAVPTVVQHTIPFSTISLEYPSARGILLGVLNVFGVGGQTIATLYTGTLARHFGEEAVLRSGSAWALAAAVVGLMLL